MSESFENSEINFKFTTSGSPVQFTLQYQFFKVTLLLATLVHPTIGEGVTLTVKESSREINTSNYGCKVLDIKLDASKISHPADGKSDHDISHVEWVASNNDSTLYLPPAHFQLDSSKEVSAKKRRRTFLDSDDEENTV
jgi:hypothetical protein